jgi:hypothetical protein
MSTTGTDAPGFAMVNTRVVPGILASLVLLATLAAYANHFQNGFHFDDDHTVVNNIFIRRIANIPLFFRDGATFSCLPANQTYRPVTTTTLAVDYWLGKGLQPFYFHLSTFVLFILQSALMFLLYLRVFELACPDHWSRLTAILATGWYLLHPVNAETINYISARSDSICTLFVVMTLVLFSQPKPARWRPLCLLAATMAILAKAIGAIAAILVLAYEIVMEKRVPLDQLFARSRRGALLDALKKSGPLVVWCLLGLAFVTKMTPRTWTPGGPSFFRYVITQPYVVLYYFTWFFWPFGLSADTDWVAFASPADPRFFIGVVFLILLVAIAVVTTRKDSLRPIGFGILWFLIALLPTSLTPLAEVMNDHRMFFPFVGLSMSAAWTLSVIVSKTRRSIPNARARVFDGTVAVAAVVVLGTYGYGTHERNKVWRTNESLWQDVSQKSPLNGRGLMNYGLCLMEKADYAGAEDHFTRALGLLPRYSYLQVNLGVLKEATGRTADAEKHFQNAITFDPGNPECYFFYARFLKNQRRPAEAIASLNHVLVLAPAHLKARQLLIETYYEQSRFDDLAQLVSDTLRIAPQDATALSYVAVLNKLGLKADNR